MVKQFLRSSSGATLIEYCVICACIALILVLGLSQLGSGTNSLFGKTQREVEGAMQHVE